MKERRKNPTTSFYNNKPQMTTIRQNGVNDKYPNDNLFKTDKRYKMNKYLDFDSHDEESFQQIHKTIFSLKIQHLSILCFLRVLYNNSYTSIEDYYKGTYYLISFTLTYYFIRVINLNNGYFKLFLKLLFKLNTLIIIFSSETRSVLSIRYVVSELFFIYMNGLFLNISLLYLIPHFTLINLIYIFKATMVNIDHHTLLGYIRAFYSANAISSFIALSFFFMIVYYYSKAKRELWVLFDSFKNSYLIFNELIFQVCDVPSFVLSKNFSILCANSNGFAFIDKLKDNKLKSKRGFNCPNENLLLNLNLLDFLNPQLKSEFMMKFNTCLSEKMQRFYFRFGCIKANREVNSNPKHSHNENQFLHKAYYDETNHMVIPSRCVWKNQESYFVRIIEDEINSSFFNYIFSYSKYLIEELMDFSHDSDKICAKFIDSEIRYEQYSLLVNKLSNRNIEQETFSKIIQHKIHLENNTFLVNEDHHHDEGFQQNSSDMSNNNHFFNLINKTNINQLFLNIDHSILFFSKNQSEVFFDLQLTKEIYTSILLQTPIITPSRLDLKSLANYFNDYFYMILRIKHIKLKFVIKCDCNISVEYSFLRTILFNTLMFIYSNTDDELIEKSLIYTIALEKESKLSSEMFDLSHKKTNKGYRSTEVVDDYSFDLFRQNNTHILRFSIVIWDDKQKSNYNEIIKDLLIRSSQQFNVQEEMSKVKKYDIGLLTLFYLITAVYSKEMEMFSKEGEHTIAFDIGCGIAKKEDAVMKFGEIDSNISDVYYKDLLRRVFHINITDEEFKEKSNAYQLESKASKNKKPYIKTFKSSISYITRSSFKVNGNNSSSKEISVAHSDIENIKDKMDFEEEDKEEDQKKSCIKERSTFKPKQQKTTLSSKSLKTHKQSESSACLSFCDPPKFLIVEDNKFAQNQLIHLIAELNTEYQIEIAKNGSKARTKLKSLSDQRKLYDIVFLDMNLPLKNGIEIAKEIRRSEKNYPLDLRTKIIGISINPDDKLDKAELFDYYSKYICSLLFFIVEKPIQKQLLFKLIQTFLSKHCIRSIQ